MVPPIAPAIPPSAPRSRFLAAARRAFGPIWLRRGLTVALTVRGRRSGRPQRVVLFLVEVDGSSYLLSQYGESDWVRNLRAAGRGDLWRKGGSQAFRGQEVDGAERDRVIVAFRSKTPGPFRRDFEQHPDAADHPTFRVEAIT